jgi:hypothetical protein
MCRRAPFIVAFLLTSTTAMAIDLAPLWDFGQPERSEQAFRAALVSATGDDVLILQTQIARSFGLRKDFVQARSLLESMAPQLATAGPEARARHALELGRSYASAAHPAESQTSEAKEIARAAYQRALAIARSAALDGLAIDAIHMLAFVDTAPADQLIWAQQALAVVEASAQADAKKWEASIRNNLGYGLHQLGRFDDALAQFNQALKLRERGTNEEATRSARWMVAWTLRALGRGDEALAMQLQLEQQCTVAQAPDRYVYEELALLFRARGDEQRADHYAALMQALPE